MSKAVMLSIRPKWVEKIASGEKTIEVRKTRPKMDTPFMCYIYCTIDGIKKMPNDYIAESVDRGKIIGEFTCDRIDRLAPANEPYGIYDIDDDYVLQTCLENGAIWDYGHGTPLYGWHISDLRIYDTPRELSEFAGLRDTKFGAAPYEIKRPPQSWCYVEAMRDE